MTDIFSRTLGKAELFAALERGHAANLTVVTPNRRLAQALASDFDRHQSGRGLQAWDAPDLLPLSAFIERIYEDALYSEGAGTLPVLLTPEQELALWEAQIRQSKSGRRLLAVPETAALARDAWSLAHAWHLMPVLAGAGFDEDSAAFADWAARYAARTERDRLTERARLPAVLERLLDSPRVRKPALLVAWGFDILTPQQKVFFKALADRGIVLAQGRPPSREGSAVRIACADAHEEFRLAARWARARLDGAQAAPAAPRIGIVVPDLAQRRHAVRRILRETLAPGSAAPGAAPRRLPFNVSLGEPLASYPLVGHALLALELAGREMEFQRASLLLRSPYIAGGESESARRNSLDAALRRRAQPVLSLDRLVALLGRDDVPGAPMLLQTLAELAAFRKARLFALQTTREWGVAFADALRLIGFPGERALDSSEYQALAKWHELLAQFARLERLLPKIGFAAALARLRRMANATDFQPESPEVPIQVLGVLEAAGMEFDHLWVTGLTDDAWPLHPRVNPFIPFAAQRAAGVPNAAPGETLSLARALTAGWLRGSGETVLSHPRREGDRDLQASPLILDIAQGELELPSFPAWRDKIRTQGMAPSSEGPVVSLERIRERASPVSVRSVRGAGAALLKNQAACPFRAFARHRLGADPMDAPHAGLDPRERGTLVHAVLAAVWREIQSKARLDALREPQFGALLERAASHAIERGLRHGAQALTGRFGKIERGRLVRLARSWLEYERRARRDLPDFHVAALEERREIEIGALKLNVRLDRVDETAAGERIVIDYKTAEAKLPSILRERPDEPQLPLYLSYSERSAGAAAFAQVRAGAMKFVGLARAERILPGARTPEQAMRQSGARANWQAQRVFWREELEQLARGYAEGRAEVDPKRPLATCRECELQVFCRIEERRQFIPQDE